MHRCFVFNPLHLSLLISLICHLNSTLSHSCFQMRSNVTLSLIFLFLLNQLTTIINYNLATITFLFRFSKLTHRKIIVLSVNHHQQQLNHLLPCLWNTTFSSSDEFSYNQVSFRWDIKTYFVFMMSLCLLTLYLLLYV